MCGLCGHVLNETRYALNGRGSIGRFVGTSAKVCIPRIHLSVKVLICVPNSIGCLVVGTVNVLASHPVTEGQSQAGGGELFQCTILVQQQLNDSTGALIEFYTSALGQGILLNTLLKFI